MADSVASPYPPWVVLLVMAVSVTVTAPAAKMPPPAAAPASPGGMPTCGAPAASAVLPDTVSVVRASGPAA